MRVGVERSRPAALTFPRSPYTAYSSRNDPLRALRNNLPDGVDLLGFAGGPTQSSYSLFKPYGTRRITEVNRQNSASFEWLVACPSGILERTGEPWDLWLQASPYTIVSSHEIVFTVQHGPEEWFLLRAKEISQSPRK